MENVDKPQFKHPLPVEKKPTEEPPAMDKTDSTKKNQRQNHALCNNAELDNLSKRTFAANTEWKIKWVLRIYCQRREHKLAKVDYDPSILRSDICFPCKLSLQDIAFVLRLFLTEVHKLNGDEYLPCILYQMVLCI